MKKLFFAILLLITGICTGQVWPMPDYIFGFEKIINAGDGVNLMELSANGTNYIGFDGPDARTTSVRLQLPDTDPVFGQILQFSTPVAGISTGIWIDGIGNDANVIAVLGATTAALPANTYSNGTLGVGATLTANANGAFPVTDGITFVTGDRILVKNEVSQLKNGLFIFTQPGTAGTPYILTRATDGDVQAEIDDETIIVQAGTANKGKLFAQQTVLPVVGTDNIVFASISSPYVTQKGAGIQVIGQISYWDNAARQLNKGSSNLTYTAATFTFSASNMSMPATNGTVGTFYKNGERVLHFYKSAGTNDNIFLGKNAGNYTAVATSNFNGNIGIGDRCLDALTSGYFNTVIGTAAGDFMTSGFSNTLNGTQAGRNISTGDRNTAMGDAALYGAAINIDINGNSAYGAVALNLINTGADNNAAFGMEAGEGVSTGDNNSYFGTRAGEGNTTFSGQVVVGYDIDAPAADFAVNIANLLGGSTFTGIPRWLGFASLVTDNTNAQLSSVDPATGDVEMVDVSSLPVGIPTLNDQRIAFGNGSNLMTSSNSLAFNEEALFQAAFNTGRTGISLSPDNNYLGDFGGQFDGFLLNIHQGDNIGYIDNDLHNGKFGINTVAPGFPLEVIGDVLVRGATYGNGMFRLSDADKYFSIGDFDGVVNSTFIKVDDDAEIITFDADNGVLVNNYKLPLTDGAAGDLMQTDGAGAVLFVTPSLPRMVGTPVHLTGQTAAIVSTTAYTTAATGSYLINYNLTLTTQASASSTISVQFKYIDGGITKTCPPSVATSVSRIVDNSTATAIGGSVMVSADNATGIAYLINYASSLAAEAIYSLDIVIMRIE